MTISRSDVIRFAIRLTLAWSVSTAVGMIGGVPLIERLIPFLTLINESIGTAYTPMLAVHHLPDGAQLTMTAYVNQAIQVHSGLTLNAGAKLTAQVSVLHCLVPLVVLFAALSAWPAATRYERLRYLAAGLPMALPVLALTVPFLLAGKIDMLLVDQAGRAGEDYPHTLLLDWMLTVESGGIWLIPLVGAALCVYGVRSRAISPEMSNRRPDWERSPVFRVSSSRHKKTGSSS